MRHAPLIVRSVALLLIGHVVAASSPLNIPPEHLEAAKNGKANFERGDFAQAERIYETLLAALPDNLYVISNLGVVRFLAG